MDAKEFFEKNRGKYFMYENHGWQRVRLVGFCGQLVIISDYRCGWATALQIMQDPDDKDKYVDETLFDVNDKLWFASIYKLQEIV